MSSCKNTYCKDRIANSSSCSKHKGSILVVDDDKDILITIEAFLQEYGGFCVKTFTDASLALKHFHQYYNCYDLVISDIMMPEITGFEFVTKIKEISPSVRALLMSASNANNFGKLSSITTVKVHVFIQKPISHEQFITIIVNLLKEEEKVEGDKIRDQTNKKITHF